MFKRMSLLAIAASLVAVVSAMPAAASHSWNNYHWARSANPFTIKLGDNLTTSDWTSHLAAASSDWSSPPTRTTSPLLTTTPPGTAKGRCKGTTGQVEVCNGTYGNNGWLGLASINVSGGTHITLGTVKVNDTYFNTATYNTPSERQHVMCQEVGHTFGLDHQSTDGRSLDTCMDYFSNTGTNAGSSLSTRPNQHDYDELTTIYTHLDSSTTIGAAATGGPGNAPDWTPAGQMESVHVEQLPNGDVQVTWIEWANPIHPTIF